MKRFLHTWLDGYLNPRRYADALCTAPAPVWGLYGTVGRALMDALLLYLPLALLGRQPTTVSYLTFLPTERYFWISILLSPAVLTVQWLFYCAAVHLVLRLAHRPSNMDTVLNINGMENLVVGTPILVWDWLCILLGLLNPILLGISHLVLSCWGLLLTPPAYRRALGLPIWLGVLLWILVVFLGLPFGIIFLRAPL